jgi:hypothetical protein
MEGGRPGFSDRYGAVGHRGLGAYWLPSLRIPGLENEFAATSLPRKTDPTGLDENYVRSCNYDRIALLGVRVGTVFPLQKPCQNFTRATGERGDAELTYEVLALYPCIRALPAPSCCL